MNTTVLTIFAAASCASLASAAPQSTWIVDAGGGPGVDFTDLQMAVDVATPGDRVLVRAGSYGAFDLDEGLALLGAPGVQVAAGSSVHDLPPSEAAVIADLELADLVVQDCGGTVLVDAVAFSGSDLDQLVRVEDSADVRIHRSNLVACCARTGLVAVGSRVEVVDSLVRGGDGEDISACGGGIADDGGDGIVADQLSLVHVAHSSVGGGQGGDQEWACCEPCFGGSAGDGGTAIRLITSDGIVAGEALDEIRAGLRGYACDPFCDGNYGHVLVANSSGGHARVSGATFFNGAGQVVTFNPGPSIDLPDPPDPFLALVGSPGAGGMVDLVIHGQEGGNVRIFVGDGAVVQDAGLYLETLVEHDQAFALGFLPPSGTIAFSFEVPLGQTAATTWFQAEVVYPESTRPTNSVALVHREAESVGTRACSPAVANSSGHAGRMAVLGSALVADDDLLLLATHLPSASNIGYFLMGTGSNTFTPPGSAGPICIAPGLLRFLPPVSNTGELAGGFARTVGTSGPVSGAITAGSTWSFQAWHRDGMDPSNLTDAVRVDFQ